MTRESEGNQEGNQKYSHRSHATALTPPPFPPSVHLFPSFYAPFPFRISFLPSSAARVLATSVTARHT